MNSARRLTTALAVAGLALFGMASCDDDGDASPSATTTSTSTSSGTPSGTHTFDETGWHPSSDQDPGFYLQPDELFRVHPTRPRLYFRADDIDWMVARGAGPLSEQWGQLEWMASSMSEESPSDPDIADCGSWFASKVQAMALLALLNDDDTYRDWVLTWAKAIGGLAMPASDGPLRDRLERLAWVYDWLYERMSDGDRAEIRDALVRYVEMMRDWDYMESPGYLGGHSRRGYAVFAMGLIALHGDYPEADGLIQQCRTHITGGYYPAQAWVADEGGYHMGWAYTSGYTSMDQPYLVWTVGTNDVVLDDWMAETSYWYLYGLRGDDLFPQAGDAFSISPGLGVTNSIYGAGIGDRGHARWYLENKVEPTSLPFLQLLLFDPDVPATPPDELALGRLFSRAGQVIARDRWDAEATHFAFKSGSFFSINHHHRDENTFTLHYRAPLAIDSGYYDAYGTEHWRNYFTRTIAHNGIVVFDPTQEMTLYGDTVSNDGGQLFRDEPQSLADIEPSGHASLDGILRFENRDELTYALGDATAAYDTDRVALAQREVVYLRQTGRDHPVVVVFDRVTSTQPSFEKRFVLHTVEQPSLSSPLMTASFGGGRLTSGTVFPTDAQLTLLGGAGNEFVVHGQNYPLDPNGAEGDAADKGIYPGSWRLEVAPGQPATEDFFLHVLFVDDDAAPAITASDFALVEDADALGVQLADTIVVFSRAPGGVTSLDYAVVDGGTHTHVVAGLPPGQTMSYHVAGAAQGTVQIGDGGCAVLQATTSDGDGIAIQ